ncbi:MAG: endonuclease/exonuclease/phosphatase family protein [Candidatus Peregrinibacteria bacterium]|nr:endonuclease/exonuclease/phosphatase family protein [Candidatus Peregrinibacteria bacterium]MDZ4244630.1 endonuclease/exonuclease/phosphatase family protein [Candidatus Gracilibacteria bacterium]
MDILLFSSVCLLFVTVISYLGNLNALFDLISHFRVHFLLAAGGIAPFAFIHPNKIVIALIAVSAIINSLEVLPWYIKPKSKKSRKKSISITSINVQFNNHNAKALIDFVLKQNPDILLLQELNEKWIKALSPLKKLYPYQFIEDPGNQFGIGILSKFEIKNKEIITEKEFNTPLLASDIKIDGKIIKIITIHPVPPFDTPMLKSRNRVFKSVAEIAQAGIYPVVVCGDFNVTMWASAYKKLIKDSGLKNSRKGYGVKGTWPFGKANHKSFQPRERKKITDLIPSFLVHKHPIKLPIDHILVSPMIMVKNMNVGPSIGSDHLPIMAELQI